MQNTVSCIVLHGLELNVYLGWTEPERAQKQIVTVDLKIQFAQPPHACFSDALTDTYCYDELITHIQSQLAHQKFKLIERLGHTIYHLVKQNTQNILVALKLTKKPPILNLTNGVSFCLNDEGCSW